MNNQYVIHTVPVRMIVAASGTILATDSFE